MAATTRVSLRSTRATPMGNRSAGVTEGRSRGYPITGMWNPGATLPSSGQRAVIALPRV
jgi:hypothetical protein